MARINGLGGVVSSLVNKLESEFKGTPAAAPKANTVKPQSADGFTPASTAAVTGKGTAAVDPNQPAAIPTGTRDYYKQRVADFERRNPGMAPPDYYLNYGDKYCQKFSNLGPNDLSPAGLKWRDATLKNLQDAIEAKRAADPAGFAQLERNPAAFKAFCYGTHPDAYIKGGLFKLPAQDLIKIATTPELKDLLGKDGLKQVADVLRQMGPQDLEHIGVATVQKAIGDIEGELGGLISHLPHIPLPHIPLPSLPFGL